MSTFRIDILGSATLPDNSGNVYAEPAAVNFQSNDLYPNSVFVFKDTATLDKLGIAFQVPQNFVGTAKIGIIWATTATSGNAVWEFDYRAIADGESGDPSTNQESVNSTVAAPGTARLLKYTEISLTSGNFSVGDWVMGVIARNGAGSDTIAASLYLIGAYFSYADA